jgi:hypothetical protein
VPSKLEVCSWKKIQDKLKTTARNDVKTKDVGRDKQIMERFLIKNATANKVTGMSVKIPAHKILLQNFLEIKIIKLIPS